MEAVSDPKWSLPHQRMGSLQTPVYTVSLPITQPPQQLGDHMNSKLVLDCQSPVSVCVYVICV